MEELDKYFSEQYDTKIQYASIEAGIEAHAEEYSFNIESELFNQLTKEQQTLWRKEIEQAVISGGYNGLDLARDPRYKENHEVKEVDLEEEIEKAFVYHESHGDDFRSDCQIETAFRTGFEDGFKCKGYISKIQVNNLEEEIKRYFNEQPIMTRSKGIDYKLIPSAEKIAKHFFELGMASRDRQSDAYIDGVKGSYTTITK